MNLIKQIPHKYIVNKKLQTSDKVHIVNVLLLIHSKKDQYLKISRIHSYNLHSLFNLKVPYSKFYHQKSYSFKSLLFL